ncbi:protein E6A [Equid gammaherpesvirus 2]|nr:protein E6A [Equid gammaherpesvirus 2]
MNTKFLRVLLLGLILLSLLQSMQGNMQKSDTSVFSQLTEDDRKGFVFEQHSPKEGSQTSLWPLYTLLKRVAKFVATLHHKPILVVWDVLVVKAIHGDVPVAAAAKNARM